MEKEILKKLHDSNENKIVVGSINTGKTGNVLVPLVNLMIEDEENFVIVDSKEEYYKIYYDDLKKEKYNIIFLNLRNPYESDSYNIFKYPYMLYNDGEKDKAYDLINQIGKSLFITVDSVDPYWNNMATSIFSGVVLGLFEDADEDEINMSSIYDFFQNDLVMIKKYIISKSNNNLVYQSLIDIVDLPKDTYLSIVSIIKSTIKPFILKTSMCNLMDNTSFDFNKLSNKKTAIFIITKDEDTSNNTLAAILINQLYSLILENKNKLKYNFVLDNFETLSSIYGFIDMLGASLFRDINFYIGVRTIDSIIKKYGSEISHLATFIYMESDSVRIEKNGIVSKTIRGRNVIKKDIYYTDNVLYPTIINNASGSKCFDLQDFLSRKFRNSVDKTLENTTKFLDKGIDKLSSKVDQILNLDKRD